MIRPQRLASLLTICLLTVGFSGAAPSAEAVAAPGGKPLEQAKSAPAGLHQIKHRGRGVRIYLPVGPGSIYYDYPYYYSRGYYPTHIGGYVYYGPSGYSSHAYSTDGGRCARWHRKCTANWGAGTDDYYGCMDYHDCE